MSDLEMGCHWRQLRCLGLILASISCAILTPHIAQAELAPGDIAIIAYQSDDPDKLAFVALAPINAGEVIRFTDDGWQSTNNFRPGEGGIQYTAPALIPEGTVVSQTNPFTSDGWIINNADLGSGNFLLSTGGDQIFAFQGAATSPSFVFGLNYNVAGWVASATSSNNTALPAALIDGDTAVNHSAASERDNGYYNGTTTGTPEQLRAAIANPANWVTSFTFQTWPNWSFEVSSSFPSVISASIASGPFNVGDSTTVTVDLSEPPEFGSPATVAVSSAAFSVNPVNVVITNPNTQGVANVTFGFSGIHTATATAVSQCTGNAVTGTFTVNAPPIAPVVDAGPDRTLTLNGGTLPILLTDSTVTDANGLTGVTYAWTPVSGSGIVGWSNRTGSVVDPTSPAEAQVTVNSTGVYVFTLTATDPTFLTANDSVTITVINAPPLGQYDPPPTYYNPARPGGIWLTNGPLKTALNGIISGHVVRSYDSARQSLQLLDLDPGNANNILLVYTGVSVPKAWDGGNTWNREHLWPQSRFPGSSDMVSDLFNLRSCNPVVNSTRGNDPYGIGANFWDPNQGAPDRGDCARSLFYDATRYMSEVTLVNGQPGANEMGDLAKLLEWHFSDPVSEGERRRNHLIYSSVDNPSYHQSNRNPFIDHPELAWTIFGGSGNNSKLYLGVTNPPTGASAVTINLGRILKNAPVPPAQSTTLTKTGGNPTTYSITQGGSAISTTSGLRQTFGSGSSSRSIDCGLSTSTVTAGLKTGTITIDNTDVSSAGTGTGSADGDDLATVNLTVLEHSNGSFNFPADQNSLIIDFGAVAVGSNPPPIQFTIWNLMTVPGFTASMDIDGIFGSGDTDELTTDLAPFSNIPGSGSLTYAASLNTAQPGAFSATYTIVNSDEDVAGAAQGVNLVLTLFATVQAPLCSAADANCSASVDIADIAAFIDVLVNDATPCSACAADLNDDALRDGRDIAAFVQALIGP